MTALVAGLVAGATITVVGTEGSLPGSDSEDRRGPGGLGVSPFTSLRGMLGDRTAARMFEVDGLGGDVPLMRAFTLSRYVPDQGWALPEGRRMPAGQPADGQLPRAPGDTVSGDERTVRVTPINWLDVWLPTYGRLRSIDPPSDGWYYDPGSGAVYSEDRRRPRAYTMTTSLAEPTTRQLRGAGTVDDAPGRYLEADRVDPRVQALARRLTRDQPTTFDKARALWQYFTDPSNGFVYDTQTAPASDPDALADFVLNGKRGFCEQYASALAVMLRSVDVPSRVAVGFTRGYENDSGSQVITSQDAHAWVEVYFDDQGWVPFDPTPLDNGRGYTPDYLDSDEAPAPDDDSGSQPESDNAAPDSESPAAGPDDDPDPQARPHPPLPAAPWPGWVTGGLLTLTTVAMLLGGRRVARGRGASLSTPVIAGVVGAWVVSLALTTWLLHWGVALAVFVGVAALVGPACAREFLRRRRLGAIARGGVSSADAAWREVVAECADRGLDLPPTRTLRQAADTIRDRFDLDADGQRQLATIVTVVEHAWYSPVGAASAPPVTGAPAHDPGADDADSAEPTLDRAVTRLRESLQRQAPVPWRGRVLPRSLLRRR